MELKTYYFTCWLTNVLVQLVFVGGFLGIDVVGNLISLVNLIGVFRIFWIYITYSDTRITITNKGGIKRGGRNIPRFSH